MRTFALICMAVLAVGAPAGAHPGKLDRYGGHEELKRQKGKLVRTYHFHRGSLQGKPFESRRHALLARREHERRQKKPAAKDADKAGEARTIEVKVAKVYEADVVKLDNRRLVKLLGVKRPAAAEARKTAREALAALVEGKQVKFEFGEPPKQGMYWRGFIWIELVDPKTKRPRKEMVNILLLRKAGCQALLEETAPRKEFFQKSLGAHHFRTRTKITKVHSAVAFWITGRKLVRLAGLQELGTAEQQEAARNWVEAQVLDKDVRYEHCTPATDAKGTPLCYIWLGPERKDMLNIMLLDQGYAEPDPTLHHALADDFRNVFANYQKRKAEAEARAEEEKQRETDSPKQQEADTPEQEAQKAPEPAD